MTYVKKLVIDPSWAVRKKMRKSVALNSQSTLLVTVGKRLTRV